MQAIPKESQSQFITHTSCDACGSSDANGVFDDGHTFCFSCNTYSDSEKSGGSPVGDKPQSVPNKGQTKQEVLLSGSPKAIPARGLTEATCKKFGYLVGKHNGQETQIAVYRDKHGKPVAQKLRTRDKRFTIVGNQRESTLFGSHLWRSGKKLVITEGEIDCLSVSQIQNNRWPVVSLPNGAPSAVKAIKDNWDYVLGFEEVILMFDMDSSGQNAALAVAETLPVGRCKIAYLPCKDANECLVQGKSAEVIQAIFQARDYRPDGIVAATDLRSAIAVDDAASSITYPYSVLNDILHGLRPYELVTIAAGSGIGKSTFVKEICYHLHQSGEQVGLIMLEESNKRTLLGLVGTHMNKNITIDRSLATDEEIVAAFDDLFGDGRHPVYLYDHFGSSDVDLICQRITYMVKALGVRWIVLDHISILCTQMGAGGFGNERQLIDYAMTKLRTLVQELGIGLILVSHVRRPDGNSGHESGGQPVRLNHLRGSASLGQLSDAVIALNVDRDEPDSDIRHLAVLKNRFTGQTSSNAGTLVFNRDSGRLLEEELTHLLGSADETDQLVSPEYNNQGDYK